MGAEALDAMGVAQDTVVIFLSDNGGYAQRLAGLTGFQGSAGSAVVLIAVIALVLALNPDNTVLGLVSYAWAGFGAAFGPAILLSLYWKRMNRNGALAGILLGGITVVVWKQLSGGIFDLYEIIPGFILATLGILLFSRIGAGPSAAMHKRYAAAELEYQQAQS